jgi:hypothetical protein
MLVNLLAEPLCALAVMGPHLGPERLAGAYGTL